VSIELYAPPAPEKIAPPKPVPEPPKPAPEPPKPQPEQPKPEPKVEAPQPKKADIALKEKQERERKQKEEKDRKDVEKREADKRDTEKKKQDEKRLAEVRDRQALEANALKEQQDRERRTAAQAANIAYIRSIQAKIKGNVLVPSDIAGNPEAIFDVVQLPTGEIIDAQLRKSSGVRVYDEAVQRAIIKSSPLPRPETPDLFQRSLTLRFRPLDK
jgi:colicin import membrane protein